MSNFGNSPYSNPSYQKPDQMQPPHQFQPPSPKSGGGKVVMIVLGVLGLFFAMGCCGCGLLVYLGMSVEGNQIAESIKDDPTIIQEIGNIESVKYNFAATSDHPDWDVFVYDVKGDKGSGKLFVTEPDMIATKMELRTVNGTKEITFDPSKLEY